MQENICNYMHQQVKGKCTGYLTETILISKTSFFVDNSIPIPIAKTIFFFDK